jgi:hypothetical protein
VGSVKEMVALPLATTMCWLLFAPSMKRYLFICNFGFDLVILTLLFLSLGYTKGGGDDRGHAHQNYSWR